MNPPTPILRRRRPGRPRTQTGATAVEYALIVGFIAAVVALSVTALGISVGGLFQPVLIFLTS